MWRAVEFFSGIGAFAEGVRGLPVEVVAAYDQDEAANRTYRANHGGEPRVRNLDAIRAGDIPPAELWWLSPPCQPFSRRGVQRDDEDPRAASFLNLITALAECRPAAVCVENVCGFAGSRVHARLLTALAAAGYGVAEVELCPTRFGVPMQRPRRFVLARRGAEARLPEAPAVPRAWEPPLAAYLSGEGARVDDAVVARYGRSFNVVRSDDPAASVICITSGYGRAMKAAGSYVRLADGGVRWLAPAEIVRLLGFSRAFAFPEDLPPAARYRLAGNSVDVRAVGWLVGALVR